MSSDRSRYNQAEFVVEEAVAVGEAKVQLRLFAHPVVAGSGGGGNGTLVGGVLGDEVNAAADGVTVHIGGYYLVHFDGLNHVCRNEVELYVARIAFGRGNAVAVDGDGAEVGTRAPHLPEACLALVVLHVDAGDAFKGVTDVGVGELATWSAETTFVIPMLFFCELMARRCPWKAPPTTTSCNSTPSFSTTSFSSVRPAGMVIFSSTGE